mgnify:CR=1 FL=1
MGRLLRVVRFAPPPHPPLPYPRGAAPPPTSPTDRDATMAPARSWAGVASEGAPAQA